MNSHVPTVAEHTETRIEEDPEAVQQEVVATALELIMKFANMLIRDPLDIEVRDERELPAAKDTLIQCFILVLMTETRPDWRKAFYDTGVQLAYFWPDIGLQRLRLPPSIFEQALNIDQSPEERQKAFLKNEDGIRAFSEAFSKIQDEHKRIEGLFDNAVDSLEAVLAPK